MCAPEGQRGVRRLHVYRYHSRVGINSADVQKFGDQIANGVHHNSSSLAATRMRETFPMLLRAACG